MFCDSHIEETSWPPEFKSVRILSEPPNNFYVKEPGVRKVETQKLYYFEP